MATLTDLEHRVLQTLHDRRFLTIEQGGHFAWPNAHRDHLVVGGLLAHPIDQRCVAAGLTAPIRCSLTPQGREQVAARAA